MELISINVGRSRTVEWKGKSVRTAIFKSPLLATAGRVRVERLGVAGDEQANLEVHGGVDKAVYVYPSEHYGPWGEELPGVELPWGAFGENLTTRWRRARRERRPDRRPIACRQRRAGGHPAPAALLQARTPPRHRRTDPAHGRDRSLWLLLRGRA